MANIPLELQLHIIESIYQMSQWKAVDYTSLRACALVCSAWTPTAQRLLFRRVPSPAIPFDRDRLDTIPLLIRTLRAKPQLSANVRSIYGTLWSTLPDVTDSDMAAQVALLELCTDVEGISLVDPVVSTALPPALEARLRAIALHPTSLRVQAGDPVFVGRLARMWPSLCALDLGTTTHDFDAAEVEEEEEDGAHHGANVWLPPPRINPTGLRDVQLRYPAWHDPWCLHLRTSGLLHGIRTLRIQGSFPPQDVLDRVAQLDSLVFSQLPQEDIVLPQRLQQVGYHPRFTVWEQEVDTFFVIAALRVLENLQLVTAARVASSAQLEALEEVCRDRGVEFEVYHDPQQLPAPPTFAKFSRLQPVQSGQASSPPSKRVLARIPMADSCSSSPVQVATLGARPKEGVWRAAGVDSLNPRTRTS
ncbi:hypothetical protein FA95DRAFT_1598804 [Auriscalpium vulgare]|uniref:Uncharacterized protein n=1 Tax=Auriscalpium vulgare TaxID=40419 RepID=A0ACB8RCI2_9AGAM|nr:hypothetical protein FA95DRAFT_1598804 [Auriscalpium vulgare]